MRKKRETRASARTRDLNGDEDNDAGTVADLFAGLSDLVNIKI